MALVSNIAQGVASGVANYFSSAQNFNILGQDKDILNIGNALNSIFVNRKDIQNKIDSNSLVEKYNIFKRYPDSLDIKIEKTEFLARTNNNGKISGEHIVKEKDKEGNEIVKEIPLEYNQNLLK